MKIRTVTALGATAMLALAGFAGPAAATGNGGGKAVGQPDVASKGQAMFKSNPKGQSDGDDNWGWRCDHNWGVGHGNPAHPYDCEGEEEIPS
jgi:hypothetical protein